MVRENTPYLNIVVTILRTPQNSPETKGEDGTRGAMLERGLQPRSSNCAGERLTRDEGLKREVVRRQFHFQFPFPFVQNSCCSPAPCIDVTPIPGFVVTSLELL